MLERTRRGLAGRPGGGGEAPQSGHRWADWWLAEISTLAGDHEDASNRLRVVCDWLDATEQLPFLETYLGCLGRSLCMLGRFDEAEQAAERARSLEETLGGLVPDYLWRQVLARVHAHRGELAEAERLAREAVAASEQTDSLDDQCRALWDLAEVLAAAGASTRRKRRSSRRSTAAGGRRTSRWPVKSASGSLSCGRRCSRRRERGPAAIPRRDSPPRWLYWSLVVRAPC